MTGVTLPATLAAVGYDIQFIVTNREEIHMTDTQTAKFLRIVAFALLNEISGIFVSVAAGVGLG